MRNYKAYGMAIALTLLSMSLLWGCQKSEPDLSKAQTLNEATGGITHEAEAAPAFSLKDLKGNTINLSDYSGQYVILNFWNTDSPYSVKGLDALSAFQSAHKDEVVVLTVHVGDPSQLEKLAKDKAVTLPILVDLDGSTAKNYLIQAFPSTYLIDKLGKIDGFVPEVLTAEGLESSFTFLKKHSEEQK